MNPSISKIAPEALSRPESSPSHTQLNASVSAAAAPLDTFPRRHLGLTDQDITEMLELIEAPSLEGLIDEAVPTSIRLNRPLKLAGLGERPLGESELLERLHQIAQKNRLCRSLIGLGYYDCMVPGVIQRNILENPGWYTQYTPYQSEISQGRLEALLNYQTMVGDLTGLPVANASLLDEATAAAEAMGMAFSIARGKKKVFLASTNCHPQTLAVLETRADGLGIDLQIADPTTFDPATGDVCGILLAYPTSDGRFIIDDGLVEKARAANAMVVMATDLLALTLLRSPGELGADIAIGSAQRFGVPLGFGGPHAAFLATTEAYKRQIPGRIIGVSRDRAGRTALRMALQTREQHIRREKATSNICTAQVLLAIMAGMYAVYHGPQGLRAIAERIHRLTSALATGLRSLGHRVDDAPFFDTLRVRVDEAGTAEILRLADEQGINLRRYEDGVGLSLDEKSSADEIETLLTLFNRGKKATDLSAEDLLTDVETGYPESLARTSDYLSHPVFHQHHTEHEMLRYLHRLQGRDLSLTSSMIPLGSCTMKLNATSEMVPISWPEFNGLHPFAPGDQTAGYQELFSTLESWLCEITGFDAFSLQPNAGAQGEYAGLLTIREYHRSQDDHQRNICLIPVSAHGTNPASAVMAGMKVVVVACDAQGNVDVEDLKAKAEKHADHLAALMVTYPSTHGVFESAIRQICDIIHQHGGRVYLDGANLNAQVGLCRPADYGADVCHLNLHKTFCIPHGGGGPGMGPIGVTRELEPFLPGHPIIKTGGSLGAVAAAPWGSASILPISWVYIALMGNAGLQRASEIAILNANYMVKRLEDHYPVLYHGESGRVAHEFILDLRPFQKSADISAEDVAKRLMDFGFHAPTMSWPVAGTLMIEPTESESRAELDRFCEALICIREEIRAVEEGKIDRDDNPLKNSPHTAEDLVADWPHPYTREQAVYPLAWVRERKFWPPVGRVDNAFGDRQLICSCPPIESYSDEGE